MAFLLRLGLALALLTTSVLSWAQSVDISMVPISNSRLEVRLRPDIDFDGIVSNVVFTVRWEAATGTHLGTLTQLPDPAQYVPLFRSGGETDANGYRYQIFVSVGMTPMNWLDGDVAWQAGQEYVIGRIAYDGPATFSIVNDPWTNEANGDYYVSLGGVDRTGVVYGGPAVGMVAKEPLAQQPLVSPNPAGNTAWIHVGPWVKGAVEWELYDATGKLVQRRGPQTVNGERRLPIDLTGRPAGIHMLRIRSGGRTYVERFVRE